MSKYENKWVALAQKDSRVVATADTLVELDRLVKNHGSVLYTRVLPQDADFAPAIVRG